MDQINNLADATIHFLEVIKRNQMKKIASKIKSEKIPEGLCPTCGTNVIRRMYVFRESTWFEYCKGEMLAYGTYQCENVHILHAEPESDHFGEPKGLIIR
jgi:predicted RNA-binding Zn-ribbon protein involved in translation (DUF1610 family)